jgi:TorA maturation chaperone TorD
MPGAGQLTIAQANLYLLLAKAFSLPGGLDSGLVNDLEALIPDLPASLQGSVEAFAGNWRQETGDAESLSLAFSRLFLGPFEILAPPYASFYLERDQQVMGEVSQWVAEYYAAVGLQPGEGPREVPDHVALECECMYFMIFQLIATGEAEWGNQIDRFHGEHLQHWIPAFANAVRKAGQHPFYTAAVDVLDKLVACGVVLEESNG